MQLPIYSQCTACAWQGISEEPSCPLCGTTLQLVPRSDGDAECGTMSAATQAATTSPPGMRTAPLPVVPPAPSRGLRVLLSCVVLVLATALGTLKLSPVVATTSQHNTAPMIATALPTSTARPQFNGTLPLVPETAATAAPSSTLTTRKSARGKASPTATPSTPTPTSSPAGPPTATPLPPAQPTTTAPAAATPTPTVPTGG